MGFLVFIGGFSMIIAMICRPMCWPPGPMVGDKLTLEMLALAGVIFSLAMLIDCLKRPARKFVHPLTKNGEYDKLIWAAAIVASLWFYFLGAIVYFFVVKKTKPESKE
jgi:hypothetical protein